MSSGLFTSSEPVRTIVQHGKPNLRLNLTGVRGGSTFPNLFEPLSSRENKDHRIISHEFGVVQLFRTCSNCRPTSPYITVVRGDLVWSNHPELTRTCPIDLLPPASQWFESQWFVEFRCCWTTSNSHKPALEACFPNQQSGSRTFTVVKPP